MGWATIRKATDEDGERLNKAARRFYDKHPEVRDYAPDEGDWYSRVDAAVMAVYDYVDGGKNTAKLWRRCVRRALGEPTADGIDWGYVGRRAD